MSDDVKSLHEELSAQKKKLAELDSLTIILREAVANLSRRVGDLGDDDDRRSVKSVGGTTKPHARVPSSSTPSKVERPTSAKPKKEETNGTTPATPPTKPARTPGVKPKITSDKKKEAWTGEEKKKDAAPKNHYFVGKRKIFYELPTKIREADPKTLKDNITTTLQLDFAYGYNGRNCRNNLFYTADGLIVYCIAAVGVVFDIKTREQRFFFGHNDDISCLAIHPNRSLVATGQVDPKGKQKPYLCIWDTKTMKEVQRITDFHDRAICTCAFSPDGAYVASVGEDDSHTVGVWKWEGKDANKPLVSTGVNKAPVYNITFNSHRNPSKGDQKDEKPEEAPADGEEEEGTKEKVEGPMLLEFCAVGQKLVKFFSLYHSETDKKNPYKLTTATPSTYAQTKQLQQFFSCATWLDRATSVVGTETGAIYQFNHQRFKKQITAHEGSVGSIGATSDGFVSCGYDGKLRFFHDSKEKSVVELPAGLKAHALDIHPSGGRILLGTASNSILEVPLDTNKHETIMTGHSNEIWALAVNPKLPLVLTGAWDQSVRLWDYSKKAPVPGKTLRGLKTGGVQSAAWSPDGTHFAIGSQDGKVELYALDQDWATPAKFSKKFHGETVDALVFSPDGKTLASGSWDMAIHLIDVATFNSLHTLKGHSSSILQLTYSTDGKHLISNSKDYEILYWSTATGKKVQESTVVDTEWHQWSCILGWPVVGAFREGADGTDVNSAHISDAKEENGYRVVATSDDFGKVNLLRYPALKPKCPIKSFDGHSSHVTRVRFNSDASYVFSTGGNDLSLFQWKHIPEPAKTE